jgi:hypothetical protein
MGVAVQRPRIGSVGGPPRGEVVTGGVQSGLRIVEDAERAVDVVQWQAFGQLAGVVAQLGVQFRQPRGELRGRGSPGRVVLHVLAEADDEPVVGVRP